MSQKKNPNDYEYGKPCVDHLGNKFKMVKDMCAYYGITESAYQSRKRRGWELERILTTPVKKYVWRRSQCDTLVMFTYAGDGDTEIFHHEPEDSNF